MHALLRSHRRTKHEDEGFTLIELLVVITILGILAAITVFSVQGIGDKGQATAAKTDESIVRTAEEAYFAKYGEYATAAQLRGANPDGVNFLATDPGYTTISVAGDKKSYTLASTVGAPIVFDQACARTNGPRILAASNTTTPFNYVQCNFIAANSPLQFSYGSSTTLAATANTAGNGDVLFASADEANVNKVIKTSDPTAGIAGTCTVGATTCDGIGSTKAQYTTGRLVVFSCKSGGTTLPPASGAPTCAAPTGGYLSGTAPATPLDVVTRLRASQTPAFPATPTSCSVKLTIADPGATLPLTPGTAASAPYGYAAWESLTSSGTGGGGMTAQQFTDMVTAGCIVKGANVTATQTNVVTGAADMAMLPKSFVVAPTGNDTNNWTPVAATLHSAIKQWAVVLNHGTVADRNLAQAFLNYLLSAAGKAVLTQFGYE